MTDQWTTTRAGSWRAFPLAVVAAMLAAGCSQTLPADATPDDEIPAGAEARLDAGVAEQLARLRHVTAPFEKLAVADSAGYSTQITGCMSDPVLGGMGFHYGKASAIDNEVNALEPEVLLYEPQRNGRMRLVAVEYIVPYAVRPRNGPAPRLYGREFLQNDAFQLWGLHAWIWRENPSGIFADWNPRVSCPAGAGEMHG